MTASIATSEGDPDFFNAEKDSTEKEEVGTPLVTGTDISANDSPSVADKQQHQQKESGQQGVLGRLFRRRKKEPTIENGATDLLDDGRENDGEEGIETATAAVVTDDDDDDEETDDSEEDSGDEQEESSDEDEDSDNDQQEENFGTFGDFAQAPKYESDDEGGEMLSLIGGPNASAAEQNSKRGLGSRVKNIIGFRQKKQVGQSSMEKQSLLARDNYETDEDDDESEDRTNQKEGLIRSSSSDYHDAVESCSDDDLGSEEGEYRLESFYPTDCYQDYAPASPTQANRQDLYGRIQGFGSESALGYNHNAMDSSASSRFYVDATSDQGLSSLDLQPDSERRGILRGVGNAVSNITHFIKQRRGDLQASDDQERKRMLQYISELEHKLAQKESELQTWKERAEQLQLEVNRQRLNVRNEEEEESEGDESSEHESDDDGNGLEATGALIVFQGDKEDNENTEVGTLIDMSPKKPVFDPLLENADRVKTEVKVNEDLMQLVTPSSGVTQVPDQPEHSDTAVENLSDLMQLVVPSSSATQLRDQPEHGDTAEGSPPKDASTAQTDATENKSMEKDLKTPTTQL